MEDVLSLANLVGIGLNDTLNITTNVIKYKQDQCLMLMMGNNNHCSICMRIVVAETIWVLGKEVCIIIQLLN